MIGVHRILRYDETKCKRDLGCSICEKICPLGVLEFVGNQLNYCRNCPPEAANCILNCPKGGAKCVGGKIVLTKKCDGCGECECRFGGIVEKGNEILKCDLCVDYGEPLCVQACPFGALEFVGVDEPAAAEEKATATRTAPELAYLGDELNFSVQDWMKFSPPSRPRIFFRMLKLPLSAKEKLLKLDGASVYRAEGFAEPIYFHDFSLGREDWRVGDEIKSQVIEKNKFMLAEKRREERIEIVKDASVKIAAQLGVEKGRREELAEVVAADVGGYSFLEFLLKNRSHIENIEQIRLGEPVHVVVRGIGNCKSNFFIPDQFAFRSIVNRLAEETNKTISEAVPKLDFFVGEADRVVALCPPYSSFGGSFSIRLSSVSDPWTLPKLIAEGTLDPLMAAYFWMLEETKVSGVITGPPGSGKTSLLNSLIQCVPEGKVVRTIEEGTRELVSGRSWSAFVGKTQEEAEVSRSRNLDSQILTGEDLLNTCLRFYVDRLYVGEIRGKEAKYFTTALNIGIPGVKTTLHTHETGASILSRLIAPPMSVPVENLPYVRLFASMRKDFGGVRRVVRVGELNWNVWGDVKKPDWEDGGGNYKMSIRDVFSFDPMSKKFRSNLRNSLVLKEYANEKGVPVSYALNELTAREKTMRELVESKIFEEGRVREVLHGQE